MSSWYKRHPGKQAAALRLHRYKLTDEEYTRLVKKQSGRCAICGGKKPLSVDHCHMSTKVRALLCNACNVGLGHFEENIVILKAAIKYLRKFS